MRFAIRADATPRMGSGHLMRCYALAQELAAAGAEVHFVGDIRGAAAESLIESGGFGLQRLTPGGDAELEDEAGAALSAGKWDWLVIDHYGIDREQQRAWRPLASRIAVVDDLADRPHDCDLLLNQNYAALGPLCYEGLLPGHCEQLLGPRYALLRPEFRAYRVDPARISGPVRRVLVSLGGSDPDNATLRILEALAEPVSNLAELQITVLAGAANPNFEQLEIFCSGRPGVKLLRHVDDPWGELSHCELVIGAGGGSAWERLCVGVATVQVTLAENQRVNAECLAADGYITHLGDPAALSAADISGALQELGDASLRAGRVSRGQDLVDGLGVSRVAQHMLGTSAPAAAGHHG